jgi:hypothetical protein
MLDFVDVGLGCECGYDGVSWRLTMLEIIMFMYAWEKDHQRNIGAPYLLKDVDSLKISKSDFSQSVFF